MKNKLFLAFIGLLILIQFFRIDKINPAVDLSQDFLKVNKTKKTVGQLIESACYDCHSHNTEYPWYTNIAPLSFWIKGHINGARQKINFSEWTNYTEKEKNHKLEESIEEIQSKHMPLKSYTWLHGNARLTDEERQTVVAYFTSLQSN